MNIKEILKGIIYGNDYMMPLWKELLYLVIVILGLNSFCSAGSYTYSGIATSSSGLPRMLIPQTEISNDVYVHCVFDLVNGYDTLYSQFRIQFSYFYGNNGYVYLNTATDYYTVNYGTSFTYDYDFSTFIKDSGPGSPYRGPTFLQFPNFWSPDGVNLSYSCTFIGQYIITAGGSCPECPSQYTSEECQAEYGLVTSGVLNQCNNNLLSCQSSLSGCQLDLNSCQSSLSGWDNTLNNCSDNLLSCQSSLSSCIAGNCPLDDGGVQWSSLFINNIQHIGAPLININIPDEISWDYTSSTGSFDLDIEGYNVDSDYIEGVINIQNSKPSKEDLNNIISRVIPLFVPGLVIIMFIYFAFKFIKKIF